MGELPVALPGLALPDVPFTLETLSIIAPVALTLAVVGLLESLLTAQLIDDITDANSDKDRESRGQGIANVATGFLGGMAGCAMIGQSMINLRSGGRTRLSTLAAGVFLLVMILVAGPVVAAIPMAALVAVMIVVAVATFDWSSITPVDAAAHPAQRDRGHGRHRRSSSCSPSNLALGVAAGVLLSAIFFARRVAHVVEVTDVVDPDGGVRIYHAHRRAVLRVDQRARPRLRLHRGHAARGHRPHRRPRLGQLRGRRARRRRRQVRTPRHRPPSSSASTCTAPSSTAALSRATLRLRGH